MIAYTQFCKMLQRCYISHETALNAYFFSHLEPILKFANILLNFNFNFYTFTFPNFFILLKCELTFETLSSFDERLNIRGYEK